jgi:hypothetical protein
MECEAEKSIFGRKELDLVAACVYRSGPGPKMRQEDPALSFEIQTPMGVDSYVPLTKNDMALVLFPVFLMKALKIFGISQGTENFLNFFKVFFSGQDIDIRHISQIKGRIKSGQDIDPFYGEEGNMALPEGVAHFYKFIPEIGIHGSAGQISGSQTFVDLLRNISGMVFQSIENKRCGIMQSDEI